MNDKIIINQINDTLKILNSTLLNFENSLQQIRLKVNDLSIAISNEHLDNEEIKNNVQELQHNTDYIIHKLDSLPQNNYYYNQQY